MTITWGCRDRSAGAVSVSILFDNYELLTAFSDRFWMGHIIVH